PMYYKGWYHFFYQHNPKASHWGDLVWGHAVSRDLINWIYLPNAMLPDQWYDVVGVWTGSANILPDGSIVVLYTGCTKEQVQNINLAYPADLSDPLLINWVKYSGNPLLYPPPGIGNMEFRDPSNVWLTPNGTWRFAIGTKYNTTGISFVFETKNFINYTLLDELLHQVPNTGIWECIDMYPVSLTSMNGLDTSVNGPQVMHVLKVSLQEQQGDFYGIGRYDVVKDIWTPDSPEVDVGIELRYDYGRFYASKTFYDQSKQRRILWGFSRECDTEDADIKKGWASLQVVPREIVFDNKTKSNLLLWPVKEVESLRSNGKEFNKVKLTAGSIVPLDVGKTAQLDITADFEIDNNALEEVMEADVGYNCTTSNGASGRSALGPFGLLVLANDGRSEQTAVYFYIAKGTDGNLKTFFCSDQSRSSKATDVSNKEIYGTTVPVLENEKLSLRILVDHSIVEAFAQGGRTAITSRVYPTEAIAGAARVFLFNNATGAAVTATSVKIWEMNSASMKFYSDQPKA
ncbi:Acid beta-fructofuranosidase, partial [Thalictrum thalictroides]